MWLFEGLGFRVWGLGFGVWGLGFGVWGLAHQLYPARHQPLTLSPKPDPPMGLLGAAMRRFRENFARAYVKVRQASRLGLGFGV